jgi:hypothetical protein
MKKAEPTSISLFHYLASTLLLTALGAFYVYRLIGGFTQETPISDQFRLSSEIVDSSLKGAGGIAHPR